MFNALYGNVSGLVGLLWGKPIRMHSIPAGQWCKDLHLIRDGSGQNRADIGPFKFDFAEIRLAKGDTGDIGLG